MKSEVFNFKFKILRPLWIAIFVDILGFTIIIPFLPYFVEQYNVEEWVIGLLLSTNAIFGFICGPILAKWSDKYGRKPLLLISQAGTLVSFVMLAFSQSLEMLFLSRIVDGLFGGNFPIAKAVIGDVVPPKDRSEQMANVGVAHILSSLIGPGLGGILYEWGILGPGLAAATLSLITIILTATQLRETLPIKLKKNGQPLPAHVKYDLDKESDLHKQRSIWQILNENQNTRQILVIWGFHTLSFTIYVTTISLFANIKLDLAPNEIGTILSISGVIRLIIRFYIYPPLLKRLGDKKIVILGLGIFVIIFMLLGFVNNIWLFSILIIGMSLGASCVRGPMNGLISKSVGPKDQGKVNGMSSSLDSLSQIIGPLIGSIILGQLVTAWFGGILSIISAVALLLILRYHQNNKNPKSLTS